MERLLPSSPSQEHDYNQCVVIDQTPDSHQKKIIMVVRSTYTIAKIIDDIEALFSYTDTEVVLQPTDVDRDLVGCILFSVWLLQYWKHLFNLHFSISPFAVVVASQ